MKAVDTNVLCRFFIADPDDEQAALQQPAAIAAMSEPVFVSITVVLEFEWVMRGFYRLSRMQCAGVLRALCGVPHVTVEERSVVLDALDASTAGLDFADALHLCRSRGPSIAFLTFDRRLARRAKKVLPSCPVELLK